MQQTSRKRKSPCENSGADRSRWSRFHFMKKNRDYQERSELIFMEGMTRYLETREPREML
jgi:hypothetical protein